MERIHTLIQLALPFSIICLAASLAYMSYALLHTVERAPTILAQAQATISTTKPITQEIHSVSEQIPAIVTEVSLVRSQIPPILKEVAELRLQLPAILEEVERVRLALPPVLEEVSAVRQEIPAIIEESKGYRELMPELLAEVAATRESIPGTMLQAQQLVAEARSAGREASEGAITGIFTGIIKAPIKIVSGAGNTLLGANHGLSHQDTALITASAQTVLNQNKIGQTHSWKSDKSGAHGKTTLIKEFTKAQRLCRTIRFEAYNRKKTLANVERTACMSDEGAWVLDSQ